VNALQAASKAVELPEGAEEALWFCSKDDKGELLFPLPTTSSSYVPSKHLSTTEDAQLFFDQAKHTAEVLLEGNDFALAQRTDSAMEEVERALKRHRS